jgi:hypothetical protein
VRLQIRGQVGECRSNIHRGYSGGFKGNWLKLVRGTIGHIQYGGCGEGLIHQDVLQLKSRLEIMIGPPQSAFHSLGRGWILERQRYNLRGLGADLPPDAKDANKDECKPLNSYH